MKILYLAVLAKKTSEKPIKLTCAEDLSDFSWFNRSSIRQHLVFSSRLFAEKLEKDVRKRIEIENLPYHAHVYIRPSGLTGVLVAEKDYDERVAFVVIDKLLQKFEEKTNGSWKQKTADCDMQNELAETLLKEHQNPEKNDKFLGMEKDLDEIKNVIHQSIADITGMGDSLEELVKKSEDLSAVSKTFAATAHRNNACCRFN